MVLSSYLQVDGAKLYYKVFGAGKPLILLHAGIADSRMWQSQIDFFSEYYQVITLDFRGYGKTVYQQGLFWHYKDVYSLINHLGLISVDLLGCSIGGLVAMELALQHPGVVGKLILVCPGLKGYEFTDKASLSKDVVLDELIASGKREKVAELLVDIWVVGLRRKKRDVKPEIRSFVREMILDNYDAVIDRIEEAELGFDVISRLGEISSQTLVIIGGKDLPDMLTISRIITDKIPQATRTLIPDTAHMINLEKSKCLNDEIRNFLELY